MAESVPLGLICDYYDYAEISFTATQIPYLVGTNANVAVAGTWPYVAGVPTLAAKRLLVYATQDCYVRFLTPVMGGATAVQMRIYADTWYSIPLAVLALYVVRVAANGTLRVVMLA